MMMAQMGCLQKMGTVSEQTGSIYLIFQYHSTYRRGILQFGISWYKFPSNAIPRYKETDMLARVALRVIMMQPLNHQQGILPYGMPRYKTETLVKIFELLLTFPYIQQDHLAWHQFLGCENSLGNKYQYLVWIPGLYPVIHWHLSVQPWLVVTLKV